MSEQSPERPLSSQKKRFDVVAMIIVGLCASALMYHITAQGPGVSPDSTVYIETARALLSGNGFFVHGQPMTHYPPIYPLLLAVVGLLTQGDILMAGRLLAAVFFGINLVLISYAVWKSTKYSLVATGCGIFLFLLSAPVIKVHSMAWSEAPFITFSMAGLLFLAQYNVRPSRYRLILVSLMVGCAVMTRYLGLTLFPTVALALLLLGNQSFRHKIRDILLFSGIACLPVVVWLIRNVLIAQSTTPRQFALHLFNPSHAKSLITQMYDFVLPISISSWTKALHVGVAATLFILASRLLYRKVGRKTSTSSIGIVLPAILVGYSVLYVTSLFFSISFFDAHTPVDYRLLLPVFLALLIAVTSIFKTLSRVWPQKSVWYGYVFVVIFSVSINAHPAISEAVDIHLNGDGYSARHWRDSSSLAYLARTPDGVEIYSNGPDVIRFLTLKKANMIPKKVFTSTRKENRGYQRQMSQMIRECEEGNAIIVYLDRVTWRWYLPSKEEIGSLFSIPVAVEMEDGVIYGRSIMQSQAEQGAALDAGSAALRQHQ